jgi:hypothetical protein
MVREPATTVADLNRALSRSPEVSAIFATDQNIRTRRVALAKRKTQRLKQESQFGAIKNRALTRAVLSKGYLIERHNHLVRLHVIFWSLHSSARECQSDPSNERILFLPGEQAVAALVGYQAK